MKLSRTTFLLASIFLISAISLVSCRKPDCVHSIIGTYRASHVIIYTNDYGNMDTTYSEFNENLDLVVKRAKGGVKTLFKGKEKDFQVTNCSGSYGWEHGGTQNYSTVEVKFSSESLQYESTYVVDQGGFTTRTVHFFTKI